MSKAYYEEGRYKGVVSAQALGKSSTGNTQFVLTFEILGGVDPTQPDSLIRVAPGQRSIFRSITEKTIDWFVDDLKFLGYNRSSFQPLDPSHQNHHSFKGMEIEVECKHKQYNGETREQWNLVTDGGGFKVEPVDNATLRKLDSLWGKKLGGGAATEPKKAAAPQNANAEPKFGTTMCLTSNFLQLQTVLLGL